MKVALVIGHRKGSPGAVNKATGISEFGFNKDLAEFIKVAIQFCEVEVICRDSYMGLPGKINELKPDFVISLHCNAYEPEPDKPRASGTETLYYHNSSKSKELATILQDKIVVCLGLKDRKIKLRHVEDRGGYLLKHTNAPCVIAEPFFIDNDKDFEKVNRSMDVLALAYIEAIREFIAYLKQLKEV